MESTLMQDWSEIPWMLAEERFADAVCAADPYQAAKCVPGSEEKVSILAARYAAGVPLWQEADKTDFSAAALKATRTTVPQPVPPALRLHS